MQMLRSLVLAAVIMISAPAQATDYLTFYTGGFNIFEHENASATAQFGMEYRAEAWDWGIRPTVGINADTDGAVYGYAGINWDVALGKPWILTPNFMVGAYHQGDSIDLGHGLEFRSGVELSYEFENQQRLGAAFNHISNASIGDENPGAESLLVVYSVPLGGLF